MNINAYLHEIAKQNGLAADNMQLPDGELDPQAIKVVMINEVVPKSPNDWFYSKFENAENRKTAFGLFEGAGLRVQSMSDVLDMGIYITTALKTPKEGYTPDPEILKAQLPLLETELSLFPNLRAVMLMGDVAKKAFNMLVKAKTKKNLIPSQSTYKIRSGEYYWGDIRVFPSYIMTGKNLLIEKGKCETISEDIKNMLEYIKP